MWKDLPFLVRVRRAPCPPLPCRPRPPPRHHSSWQDGVVFSVDLVRPRHPNPNPNPDQDGVVFSVDTIKSKARQSYQPVL